jgi:type IV pilus assembly protein PilE
MNIGTRQQQMLLDARSYTATAASLSITVPPQVTTHYTISVSAPASTPPSFTATATPQGDQTKDKCGTLGVDHTGTKTAVKNGNAQTGCW